MAKRSICSTITQVRSNVNFGNNLREARAKKVRFYFVTLKWHRTTCYVNWAILTGDPVDVKTLLVGGVLLFLHIVGQGPVVLAAGVVRVGYIFYIFHLSSLSNVSAVKPQQ